MALTGDESPHVRTKSTTSGDGFSLSVILLVGVMLSQRAIGLVRNVLFCGLLSEEELGRWALANNYLGWAAPFIVLGLPGSFGRLSEHFRQRGQLRTLLKRTAIVSSTLAACAVTLHLVAPSAFARLIYNHPEQARLVPLIGLVLAAALVMNYLVDFLISIRLNRIVSRMHLVHSLAFAAVSVLLLMSTTWRESSVLAAYGIASLLSALLGFVYVRKFWHELPVVTAPEANRTMWSKVSTLAVWIWCGNSVANLFDCIDQFLLKHCCDLDPTIVDSMIGQLYASRVLPVLIVSVATLIAGCLLPYLIQDWEAGRKEAVRLRMNSVMKCSAIGFTAVAAVTHIANPILFNWLLRGRYAEGLDLMPWGFVQYTWFSLLVIGTKFLICIDRPRTGIRPFLVGLASAAILNLLLVPHWGLPGAVVAMATANGLALISMLRVTSQCGMQWDRGALLAAATPLAMCLGGWPALGILAGLLIGSWKGNWLLSAADRQQLQSVWTQLRSRAWPHLSATKSHAGS